MKKIDLANLPAVWRQKITTETAENQPIEIPQSNDPKVNGNSHTTNPECQYRHERIVSKIEEDRRLKKPNSIQDFHNFCKVLVGELECCNKPKPMFDNILTFVRQGRLEQISSGYRAFYETHKDLVDRASAIDRKYKLMFKEIQENKWSLVPIKGNRKTKATAARQRKDKGNEWLTPQRKKFYQKRIEDFAKWLENELAGNNKVKNNPTYIRYIKIALNHKDPHHKNIPLIYQDTIERNFELISRYNSKLAGCYAEEDKLISKLKKENEYNYLTMTYDELVEQNATISTLLKKTCDKHELTCDNSLIQMIVALDSEISRVKAEMKILKGTINSTDELNKQASKMIDIGTFLEQLKEQNVNEFNIKFNNNDLVR